MSTSTNTLEMHRHNLCDEFVQSRSRTVRGFGYMQLSLQEQSA